MALPPLLGSLLLSWLVAVNLYFSQGSWHSRRQGLSFRTSEPLGVITAE